jgi:uncharacterized surface protein with fasciclin (FAS1) repeats
MKSITISAFALAALGLTGCQTMADDGMSDTTASTSSSTSATTSAPAASASATTTVGGATMYPNRTIVQNATNSPIHRQLVAAVAAAGLVDTLSRAGPFTVFAPTDEAFNRIDAAQRANLMMPAQREQLAALLTYHVVPGRITAADLEARLAAGGDMATLTTVQGSPIRVAKVGNAIELTGVNGGKSYVTQADVMQSNGVIHVVNGVLVPSL